MTTGLGDVGSGEGNGGRGRWDVTEDDDGGRGMRQLKDMTKGTMGKWNYN